MENLLFNGFNMWILIKALALILFGMYIIFAFVITRQVRLMTNTLQLGYESLTKFLAFVHLLFAILVFLSAFILL